MGLIHPSHARTWAAATAIACLLAWLLESLDHARAAQGRGDRRLIWCLPATEEYLSRV
jgi:hypothetical protein